jgi:alcohol dehydrogenase
MNEHGTLGPAAVVAETVSLDETPERLNAMSDYGTVGIPVIDEF